MSNENCRALLESVHEELTNMGFNADDSIDGGDFVEYGGKLYVDIGEALERDAERIMAARWVKLFNEWQDSDLTSTYDFGDWLDMVHPGERETLTWIASWDARPVDACLKADPRRAIAFAVMDFGDGSIAIKRAWATIGDEGDRRWMVAS